MEVRLTSVECVAVLVAVLHKPAPQNNIALEFHHTSSNFLVDATNAILKM
jgi:hypothetical protein